MEVSCIDYFISLRIRKFSCFSKTLIHTFPALNSSFRNCIQKLRWKWFKLNAQYNRRGRNHTRFCVTFILINRRIGLSAVQSFARILIYNAFWLINTSTMLWYNKGHWTRPAKRLNLAIIAPDDIYLQLKTFKGCRLFRKGVII